MLPIRTDRLTVRNFSIDDWKALHGIIAKYQQSEYALYDHKWPTTEEGIRSVVEGFSQGDSFLAVSLRDTDRLIGFVALNCSSGGGEVREFNLGYCIDSDYHGHGYATEACQALLGHAFGNLGADKICTGAAAANTPSVRLAERLGMKIIDEGISSLRTDEQGRPIEFLGLSFSISRDEWIETMKS